MESERLVRVETRLEGVCQRLDRIEAMLSNGLNGRMRRIERLLYVSLGVAVGSGLPGIAALMSLVP